MAVDKLTQMDISINVNEVFSFLPNQQHSESLNKKVLFSMLSLKCGVQTGTSWMLVIIAIILFLLTGLLFFSEIKLSIFVLQ